jgi:hypothetical protein
MGDLEDAIRDHLELKRRRGADPTEVAREEHDALAPVTRSHPIVAAPPPPVDAPAPNGEVEEDEHDATQEFLVTHDEPDEPPSWLDEAQAG